VKRRGEGGDREEGEEVGGRWGEEGRSDFLYAEGAKVAEDAKKRRWGKGE